MGTLQDNAKGSAAAPTKSEEKILVLTSVGDTIFAIRRDDLKFQDAVNAKPQHW